MVTEKGPLQAAVVRVLSRVQGEENPDCLQHQEERQSDTKQQLQKRTPIVAEAVAIHTHDGAPN